MTQCEKIHRHLQDYGSITPVEALREYGVMRLAARIKDLKKRGVAIQSRRTSGTNRYGERVRYSVYSLEVTRDNEESACIVELKPSLEPCPFCERRSAIMMKNQRQISIACSICMRIAVSVDAKIFGEHATQRAIDEWNRMVAYER